jgi:hypothetical protein
MPARSTRAEIAAKEVPCRDQTFRGEQLESHFKKMKDKNDPWGHKQWVQCLICEVQQRFDGHDAQVAVFIEKHKHSRVQIASLEQYGFTIASAEGLRLFRDDVLRAKLVMLAAGNMSFLFGAGDELRKYGLLCCELGRRYPNIPAETLIPRDTRQSLASEFRALASQASSQAMAPLIEAGIVALVFDAVTIKGVGSLVVSVASPVSGAEPWLMLIASPFAGNRVAYRGALCDSSAVADALDMGIAGTSDNRPVQMSIAPADSPHFFGRVDDGDSTPSCWAQRVSAAQATRFGSGSVMARASSMRSARCSAVSPRPAKCSTRRRFGRSSTCARR